MKVRVDITRRSGIADPEATTVATALQNLGFDTVVDLSFVRSWVIELAADDEAAAEETVHRMCEVLLANPVIEDYTLEVLADA